MMMSTGTIKSYFVHHNQKMSVNEVKIKTASKLFEVRGTGPPSSRTFAIGNEDHTLGNCLRHVLVQNAKVGFAGYSVPHPAEPIVHIRIQAVEPTTAIQAIEEACETLYQQCEIVLSKLEEKLPEVKEDRLHIEDSIAKMAEDDMDEDMPRGDDYDDFMHG